MELNMLLELSATVLDLLIKRFKTGQLTYEEFVNNTKLKISFIKDNINYIAIPEQMENIELLLQEYEQILSRNHHTLGLCSNL